MNWHDLLLSFEAHRRELLRDATAYRMMRQVRDRQVSRAGRQHRAVMFWPGNW